MRGTNTYGPVPTVDERVTSHIEDGTLDLYICRHAWALRHRLVDKETGEVIRMRCNLWTCLHCGPRKVNEWRQLIAEAKPTHHLTLSKAGQTVEEAARALTTFMQALRRGSKGRGLARAGARQAYPIEYLAVLERHTNFEENGFHWHILLISYAEDGTLLDIPYKEVLQPLWASARHGKAENGWIQRIRNTRAIGYVTKYLTKDIFRQEKGTKKKMTREQVPVYQVKGEWNAGRVLGLVTDDDGNVVKEEKITETEVVSRARRIRYSRGFFPESTKVLRARLFAELDQPQNLSEQGAGEAETSVQGEEKPVSRWQLVEVVPAGEKKDQYQGWVREGLRNVLEQRQAAGKKLSRRVLTIWNYQREQVGRSSKRELFSAFTLRRWVGKLVDIVLPDLGRVQGQIQEATERGDMLIRRLDDSMNSLVPVSVYSSNELLLQLARA